MRAAKDELRRSMKDRRAIVPGDVARRAADQASAYALALPAAHYGRVVALYRPVRGELDTATIARTLRARGATIVYPRVMPGRELRFHALDDDARLVASRLGIPEPPADLPVVPLEAIELFIVPGLAFDPTGGRLGWGRGYFDHTLAAAPQALRVGYGYELQIVPTVPSSADDVRVDVLCTESGARPTGARPLSPHWRVF